jgi:putative spermidine/putrescine transport system permease protein
MNRKALILLKLCPLIVPFAAIFTTGISLTIIQSLGYFIPVPGVRHGLDAYRMIFGEIWFYKDLGFTLYCAFASSVVAVGMGTALSYALWRTPRRFQQASILTKIPLILPHIAVAFIVLMFFGQTGYISSILTRLGLIEGQEHFPTILFGGKGFGIILSYVYKEVPFVMLLVTAVLKRFDERQIQTARMFGAGRLTVFTRVVLPSLLPVIHTSFIILFLYSFGAFDIPFMIGESHPGMLSVQVYNLYFKRDIANRPHVMAILVVMFAFSLVFIYLYSRVSSKIDVSIRKL